MSKTQLSKSDQIRTLLHLPNAEIARRTGKTESYVRTIRQRTSENGNPIRSNGDRVWYPRKLQSQNDRYASDPEYRQRVKERVAQSRKRRAEARA